MSDVSEQHDNALDLYYAAETQCSLVEDVYGNDIKGMPHCSQHLAAESPPEDPPPSSPVRAPPPPFPPFPALSPPPPLLFFPLFLRLTWKQRLGGVCREMATLSCTRTTLSVERQLKILSMSHWSKLYTDSYSPVFLLSFQLTVFSRPFHSAFSGPSSASPANISSSSPHLESIFAEPQPGQCKRRQRDTHRPSRRPAPVPCSGGKAFFPFIHWGPELGV